MMKKKKKKRGKCQKTKTEDEKDASCYAKRTFSPGRPSERRTTAYFPEIFHPGSFSSNSSAILFSWNPTTTSLLIVLKLATGGAPAKLAIGPIATSNGVAAGAAQSYVNLR